MRLFVLHIALLCSSVLFSQQNLLPLHSFYKDQLYANKNGLRINNGSFLPVSEGEVDLISAINDSSKQYYTVTEILFKRHLFEVKGEDFQINISPLINFSRLKDLNDTSSRQLFQNTRGIIIEADLFENFSFATMFFENQGRFAIYEDQLYRSLGELYPRPDSTYLTQNAVIPGAGRTKDFKGDGLDYAYAIGYLSYLPFKKLRFTAGNNQQFIGDGHRSILLSDHSYSAPYLRFDYKISSKWRYSYYRARTMNLMRRVLQSSSEAFYEIRNLSVNYLTFSPTNNINISLFEGTQWNRGDSLETTRLHPLYYNPIPLVNTIALNNTGENASLLGLNFGVSLLNNHRLYSQVAMFDLRSELIGFQVGYRGYRFFGLNDLMLQMELNVIPQEFYQNSNPRLNYTHYNMPLAHTKGQGFTEALIRINYEFKRWYADVSNSTFFIKNYSERDLLSIYGTKDRSDGIISNTNIEVGYRFNRKVNLQSFIAMRYRADLSGAVKDAALFSFGLKTGLINHYTDF